MFLNKNKNNVGMYIHIPFCVKKCPYCDFYSIGIPHDRKLTKLYIQTLKEEIKSYKKYMKQYKFNVDTIYFGGGTPTLLNPEDIVDIVNLIKKVFGKDIKEVTVEANPNSVDEDELKILFKGGVTRISFGVQSGNDDELYILERSHSAEESEKAIKLAKSVGFNNISIDLMLGLPYQSIDKVNKSLDFLNTLDIQHVSAYILKIEKGTRFDNDKVRQQIPSEEDQVQIYLHVVDCLEKMGYNQYEISNFAKDGYQSKHNLKYWNNEEYIGLGAGAHSYFKGIRYEQQRNIYKYIGMSMDKKFEYIVQDNSDVFNEYVMLKLRTNAGIDFEELKCKYPEIFIKEFVENIKKYYDPNLIQMDDQRVRLTPKGFMIFNTILSNIMVN